MYVDDILVFSPDLSSHVVHLREVFELCRLHSLTVGLPKCVFAVSEIEFLGHKLTSSGCQPLRKHTSAIKDFPTLTDKPALQRFLGMVNFYRKFIKDAALILAPLTNTLNALVNSYCGPHLGICLSSSQTSSLRHAYSSFTRFLVQLCQWLLMLLILMLEQFSSSARELVSLILLLQEAE